MENNQYPYDHRANFEPPIPPQHNQNAYYGYPTPPPKQTNNLSVASLVLGIVADSLMVITCCVFPYISLVCSIVGLILGIMGNKKTSSNVAVGGIITCVIGLILSLISAFLVGLLVLGVSY